MAGASSVYDPRAFTQLTFHDAVEGFIVGRDTPRKYLERCLETIEAREPIVQAWTALRIDGARTDADAATERYRNGRPLSSVDGMPIGIKDLIETRDLPTSMGIAGHSQPGTKDSASIRGLRRAGVIMLGKTVTTELGLAAAGPTTNPFDACRTPGGSSSGSAAAVAARMVPACIGTQVGGSLMRPSSYCGNFALRPTLGALNRGERLGYSHGVIGVHAGCLTDMWRLAAQIGRTAGGDPGYPGLFGGMDLAASQKPARLIVVETEGWGFVDEKTMAGFEAVLAQLRAAGVELIGRSGNPLVERFEESINEAGAMVQQFIAWENRPVVEGLLESLSVPLAPSSLALSRNDDMTLDDYRAALARRDEARARLRDLAPVASAIITLTSPSPAPPFKAPADPDPRIPYGSTGNARFNVATSILGVPAVNLPLLGIDGMPVGVQIIGQQHQDDQITGIARWVAEAVQPIVVV